MAINKKLIHFNNFDTFNSQKLSANITNTSYTFGIDGGELDGNPDILYQSIVFIKDTNQIWTHGQIYNCGLSRENFNKLTILRPIDDIVEDEQDVYEGTVCYVKSRGRCMGDYSIHGFTMDDYCAYNPMSPGDKYKGRQDILYYLTYNAPYGSLELFYDNGANLIPINLELLDRAIKVIDAIEPVIENIQDLFGYGVEWDVNVPDPHLKRVGNLSLHQTLPIQSQLKGCIAQGEKVMYWLDENDWNWRKDPEYITIVAANGSSQNYIILSSEDMQKVGVGMKLRIENSYTSGTITSIENGQIVLSWDSMSPSGNIVGKRLEVGARLDGYDGTVRVYCPEFYIKSFENGSKRKVMISEIKMDDSWTHQPEILIDAYRCTLLDTVPENMGYLSTLPVNSAVSIVNTNTYCRGGYGSRSTYDKYLTGESAERDIFRTELGKPRTGKPLSEMRENAKKTNSSIMSYNQYKNIFYWLYVIEYANFNCQEEFDSESNYRGLGNGVTTCTSRLTTYNTRGPLVPCGFGNQFGNGTDINYSMYISYFDGYSDPSIQVPRWRGFDSIFGDTGTVLDGIIVDATDSYQQKVYVCSDPYYFSNTLNDHYKYVGFIPATEGYTTEFLLNDSADILPKAVGGSTTTYKCDKFWPGTASDKLRQVVVGGDSTDAGDAGIGAIATSTYLDQAVVMFSFRTVSKYVILP